MVMTSNTASSIDDRNGDDTRRITLPVAFRFSVRIGDMDATGTAFREVGGLETELEVDTVAHCQGGAFLLPRGWKHPRLTLSRGIAARDTALVAWCRRTLENGLNVPIEPMDVQVNLLDANGDPLCTWALSDAYPVKWAIDPFGSTKNEVALERIELVYAGLKREA